MAKRKKNQQNRATPIKRGESAKKTETISKDVGKRVNKPAEDADQEDGGDTAKIGHNGRPIDHGWIEPPQRLEGGRRMAGDAAHKKAGGERFIGTAAHHGQAQVP